jgi:hypothetical protein
MLSTVTPTFAPPIPVPAAKRHHGRWIVATMAVLAVIGVATHKPAAEAPSRPASDIGVMSINAAWETSGPAVCAAFNDAVAAGNDRAFVINYSIDAFEEGWGSPITPAMDSALRANIETC